MDSIFEEAKRIVRANPKEFQQEIEAIAYRIMNGQENPQPAEIQRAFHNLWPTAQGKEVVIIGWLLSDNAIGYGLLAVNHTLSESLLDHFEGDDSLNPSTLQDWIQGDIFQKDESKQRLADAVRAFDVYGILSAAMEECEMSPQAACDVNSTKLKEPTKEMNQAYLLYTSMGISQADVGKEMGVEQYEICRWVKCVRRWREHNGLPVDDKRTKPKINTKIDAAEKGRRTDGRKPFKEPA